MSDAGKRATRYRFAGFELEPDERRLLGPAGAITLTPKAFDTLVLLVERAGRLVSRDELMAALWPRGFVTDGNLAKHIWAIRKALGASGDNDPRFIETVPKLGYRFVATVQRLDNIQPTLIELADDDASGSGTAATVEAGKHDPDSVRLGRRSSDPLAPAAVVLPRRSYRWLMVATLCVLVVAGTAGGLWWQRGHVRAEALPPPAPGTSVAIGGFDNLSKNPRDAWLDSALTEMLATEVGTSSALRVMPDEQVRPARVDLSVQATGGYPAASLAALRRRVGADYVISGSYMVSGGGDSADVRVDVAVQDARNGALITRFTATRPVADLLKLVTDAGSRVRGGLGLPVIAEAAARQLAGAQPPNTEVARHVGFAMDALKRYDPAGARDQLLQAVAQAPAYAPAYALLSRAWSDLGHPDKARAAIEQAAAHAAGLPQAQRLQIEAQQHHLAHDWTAAAKSLDALIALRPDDPEPRLTLVAILLDAGNGNAARVALDQLRTTVPDAANDPRVEGALVDIETALGHFPQAREHAKKALELARLRDAPGLIAQAELRYGSTLEHAMTFDGPLEAQMEQQAIAGFERLGNLSGMADAYVLLSNATNQSLQARREALGKALALYQRIGDLGGQGLAYIGLSRVLNEAGDADGAEAALKHALAVQTSQGDRKGQLWSLMGIARIESGRSAGDATLAVYKDILTRAAQQDNTAITIYTLANYADVLRQRGDLEAAYANCQQAAKLAREHGEFVATINDLCAPTARDRGDLATALAAWTRNTEHKRQEAKESLTASVTTLPMARLEAQRGHWKKARALLDPWAGTPQTDGKLDQGAVVVRARALALQALCDAKLGEPGASRAAAKRAGSLRARILQPRAAFDVDLSLAQVQAADGQPHEAVSRLLALAADADHRFWMASALEARLAAYHLLRDLNDPAAPKLRGQIFDVARVNGFKWVQVRLDGSTQAIAAMVRGGT